MAFYKNDGGRLGVAPNFVISPTFELRAELHDTYTYPQDGWHWFDSESEAREALSLPDDALAS